MKLKNYEIIDFEQKGNCVRFYLGKNGDQFGDDWDSARTKHIRYRYLLRIMRLNKERKEVEKNENAKEVVRKH